MGSTSISSGALSWSNILILSIKNNQQQRGKNIYIKFDFLYKCAYAILTGEESECYAFVTLSYYEHCLLMSLSKYTRMWTSMQFYLICLPSSATLFKFHREI